jgi:hypothetical protein
LLEEDTACTVETALAFVAATRQGLKAWMLPDLVVELAARGGMALTVAEVILSAIRARYRAGVIEHSLARLQEVEHRAESRGASEGGDFTGGGAP